MTRYRYPYRRAGRISAMEAAAVFAGALVVAALVQNGASHYPDSHAHTTAASGMAIPAHYSGNEQLANDMAASGYGWTGHQASCLDWLWTRESAGTWSPTVVNPDSGAYGIPQSLPAGKMAAAGANWQTSAVTQIRWGLGYIDDTYSTPCEAWAHEEAAGWY
jgi:hypothetical protein